MTMQPEPMGGEKRDDLFGRGRPRLTTKQAAHHIGISIRTLEGLRSRDRGPLTYKLGRNWYYYIDDLESWARGRVRGDRA